MFDRRDVERGSKPREIRLQRCADKWYERGFFIERGTRQHTISQRFVLGFVKRIDPRKHSVHAVARLRTDVSHDIGQILPPLW